MAKKRGKKGGKKNDMPMMSEEEMTLAPHASAGVMKRGKGKKRGKMPMQPMMPRAGMM